MKRLQLRDTTPTEPSKTRQMAEYAKEQMKDWLAYEIQSLAEKFHGMPNFENDEEWVVESERLVETPTINVYVHDSYLVGEDTLQTKVKITEIHTALDGSVLFRNKEEDEWDWTDISYEDLTNIADIVERTYKKAVK